jgi:hypothetical protein
MGLLAHPLTVMEHGHREGTQPSWLPTEVAHTPATRVSSSRFPTRVIDITLQQLCFPNGSKKTLLPEETTTKKDHAITAL